MSCGGGADTLCVTGIAGTIMTSAGHGRRRSLL
jgi:hypothetical protein